MDPYVGEIRAVAFPFAPRNWALCQGQVLSISTNTALFSLLGTIYGGDGKSTFGLPNLQGRISVGNGSGPGLSPYALGEMAGLATVNLTTATMAPHGHTIPVSSVTGPGTDNPSPTTILGGNAEPRRPTVASYYVTPQTQATTSVTMANVVGQAGNGGAHNNMSPYVAMYYIIALSGIFPPRS